MLPISPHLLRRRNQNPPPIPLSPKSTTAWTWRNVAAGCSIVFLLALGIFLLIKVFECDSQVLWIVDLISSAFSAARANQVQVATSSHLHATPTAAQDDSPTEQQEEATDAANPPLSVAAPTSTGEKQHPLIEETTLAPDRIPKLANSNEAEARAVLERLLGVPFPNVRPPWLLNEATKRRLECDCLNEELALCVEVSGRQHYEYPNAFHKSREEFEKQQFRDRLKAKLLAAHHVSLIVVPYKIKRKQIESYLRGELTRIGFLPSVSGEHESRDLVRPVRQRRASS